MQHFTKIGLMGRPGNQEIVDSLIAVISFLENRADTTIVLDESVSGLLPEHDFKVSPRTDMHLYCDLVIVIGGDGSMLKAAPLLAEQNIPVVGINRGRLGFLTDIRPDELAPMLGKVLDGEYKEESRFLLDVSMQDGHPIGCAFNDVVLHPGIAAQMIEFSLYIDDRFVYNQASDGLIVATPTGSTAYSMSAGGPIMHPRLDALVLVPMYPHSLSSRPIVVDGDSEITILIGDRNNTHPQISCDGSVEFTTKPGDRVLIRKKAHKLRLLHPVDYDYYETCRSKLGWSSRLGKA